MNMKSVWRQETTGALNTASMAACLLQINMRHALPETTTLSPSPHPHLPPEPRRDAPTDSSKPNSDSHLHGLRTQLSRLGLSTLWNIPEATAAPVQ